MRYPFHKTALSVTDTSAGDKPHTGRRRRVWIAVAALLAIVSGTLVVASHAAAQDSSIGARITARKLESGRIEFGLQQRQTDGSWGARQLPSARFFPTTARVGQWLNSSALALSVGNVRITARKLESGRIEFGLQQRQTDGSWGARQLPNARFFPTTARVGQWLNSSALTLTPPGAASGSIGSTGSTGTTGTSAPTSTPSGTATTYSQVSAGDQHTCALSTEGHVTCWGSNRNGESNPPDVTFKSISAGRRSTCGVSEDNTLACWGAVERRTFAGQPTLEPPDGQFEAVTVALLHACGLRTDGTIVCWGDNEEGQIEPFDGTYRAVSTGVQHTCAVRADKTLECKGDGSRANPPDGEFTDVSAGDQHNCGLRTDDTVECWGQSRAGQADARRGEFTSVSAGGLHTCGLRPDGTVECWGSPWRQQTVPPDGEFTSVSAGGLHTCGLRPDKSIECWGDNRQGQTNVPGS